jgi:replicative DNA helicase
MNSDQQPQPRIAPNSKDSEMMVLGCMLNSPENLRIAAEVLAIDNFYFSEHKTIFECLKRAHKDDKPADVHLICEELKRLNKLSSIGGAPYLTTLAQYAGTSAYVEQYVELIRDKSLLRKVIDAAQLVEKKALEESENVQEIIDECKKTFDKISGQKQAVLPIVPISERIQSHHTTLEKYRGKKYLGLRVKTIHEFNEKMLGLRKLILLAAAPNVGKTALTIQLAKEVLLTEQDACLLYVSLEMDAEEIFTRMNLYLSELDFNTYVLGSQQEDTSDGHQNFFSKEELRKITSANKQIEKIGDRLQIIDMSSCYDLSAEFIIKYVETLKKRTGCSRSIVVVDYLQVWPIPEHKRFTSDLEADKWRIGEIKKIKDALQKENQDPVIVISEARKPSTGNETWGSDLSDVMGSARGTYSPDAVLLLSTLSSKEVDTLCAKMKAKDILSKKIASRFDDIQQFLAHHGISFCNLKMPKGRDGMKRFSTDLAFHFRKNKFDTIKWQEILILDTKEN